MTANKLIAMLLMWVIGQLICLSFNGEVFGASGQDGFRAMLNNFTLYRVIADGWAFDNVKLPADFVSDLGKIFFFDYPFFTGYLIVVRILLICLSAGCIWGIFQTLRR